jgi:hypothetical protein
MNKEQLEKMTHGKGFIAALDQSGGSILNITFIYSMIKITFYLKFFYLKMMKNHIIVVINYDLDV